MTRPMKRRALATFLLGSAFTLPSAAQTVRDTSYQDTAGSRVLRMEVDAPVSVKEAWRLWTTSDGLRSWMAPVIDVELRVGGKWEASYDPQKKIGDEGNIHNEILSYVPYRMVSMRVAKFPDDYPLDQEKVRKTHTVVLFEELDEDRTRVIVCGVGYGDGPDWDAIYRVGVQSTRYSLELFHKRCVTPETPVEPGR